jgi:hypothetical protein
MSIWYPCFINGAHIHELRRLIGAQPVQSVHHIASGRVMAVAETCGQKEDHVGA